MRKINSHEAVVLMYLICAIVVCFCIYVTKCGFWILLLFFLNIESEVKKDNDDNKRV